MATRGAGGAAQDLGETMSSWTDETDESDRCRCDVRGCGREAAMDHDHDGKLAPPSGWTRYERNRAARPALRGFIIVCDRCTALGAERQDGMKPSHFVFELVLREAPR
jgi:hypothetical protein